MLLRRIFEVMPAPFSRRAFLLSGAATSGLARLVRAQDEKDTKFTTDVRVVNLFATVRDKQGKIVRDLVQEDFTLDEDGHPQVIRYFSRESNLPLTLGLLVDTSGSMRRVLGQEHTASYRFLDQVLTEKDQAFVIHFDREVELLQDLTSSRKKLEDALAELEPTEPQRQRGQRGGGGGYPGGGRRGGGGGGGGGGTELYDAVLLASDELMKKQTGRKALILLTDGVDNGSKVPLSRAVDSAQLADTLVYGIRIADPDANGNNFGRRAAAGCTDAARLRPTSTATASTARKFCSAFASRPGELISTSPISNPSTPSTASCRKNCAISTVSATRRIAVAQAPAIAESIWR